MAIDGGVKAGPNPADARFMTRAIELSVENVKRGGGPFGAVVVLNGEIVGEGANRVTLDCDPSAHAEVVAIRAAARRLNQFHLEGCVVYTSCEPCPMCLSAIYWAHISAIYYAASAEDAAAAGFADAFLYEQLRLPREERQIPVVHFAHEGKLSAFDEWARSPKRIDY